MYRVPSGRGVAAKGFGVAACHRRACRGRDRASKRAPPRPRTIGCEKPWRCKARDLKRDSFASSISTGSWRLPSDISLSPVAGGDDFFLAVSSSSQFPKRNTSFSLVLARHQTTDEPRHQYRAAYFTRAEFRALAIYVAEFRSIQGCHPLTISYRLSCISPKTTWHCFARTHNFDAVNWIASNGLQALLEWIQSSSRAKSGMPSGSLEDQIFRIGF